MKHLPDRVRLLADLTALDFVRKSCCVNLFPKILTLTETRPNGVLSCGHILIKKKEILPNPDRKALPGFVSMTWLLVRGKGRRGKAAGFASPAFFLEIVIVFLRPQSVFF